MRKSVLGKIMMVPLVACLVCGCGSNPQATPGSQAGSESQAASGTQAEPGLTSGEADAADAVAGAYRVRVTDQDGNPVEGAMVQLCTDDVCEVSPTGSDGLASFDDPEGAYEVHILKVPEGYKGTDEVFETEAAYGDVNITIEKERA